MPAKPDAVAVADITAVHVDDDDDDDDSSSSCYVDMGFMFEGAEPSHTLSLTFTARHESAAAAATTRRARGSAAVSDEEEEQVGVDEGGPSSTADDSAAGSDATVRVELTAADGDPGAVQSGHYLWPAAPAMAQCLVDSILLGGVGAAAPEAAGDNEESAIEAGGGGRLRLPLDRPLAVAELGAGCGLAGIAALQALTIHVLRGSSRRGRRHMEHDDSHWNEEESGSGPGTGAALASSVVRCVAFTDHDPGTLDRAGNNLAATLCALERFEGECTACMRQGESSLANEIESVPILFEPLSWGDEAGAADLRRKATECENIIREKAGGTNDASRYSSFDLVLGSDVIYCKEVVRPLLHTAKLLMTPAASENQTSSDNAQQPPSVFVMTQSFRYEDDTEAEINKACSELGLVRTVLSDDLDMGEVGVKLQTFTLA